MNSQLKSTRQPAGTGAAFSLELAKTENQSGYMQNSPWLKIILILWSTDKENLDGVIWTARSAGENHATAL